MLAELRWLLMKQQQMVFIGVVMNVITILNGYIVCNRILPGLGYAVIPVAQQATIV